MIASSVFFFFSSIRRHVTGALVAACFAGYCGLVIPAQAFSLNDDKNATPIEVEADNGMEWLQDQSKVVATGNAVATRADVTVKGDVLTAFYRDDAGGAMQIYKLVADGNVVIQSPTETAYADKATYDVDTENLELYGETVTLKTGRDVVTAHESIIYYQAQNFAEAKGQVEAQATTTAEGTRRMKAEIVRLYFAGEARNVKRMHAWGNAEVWDAAQYIRAGRLTATFFQDAADTTKINTIATAGGVYMKTKEDKVWGDTATYNARTEQAVVQGNVRIRRGENELYGDRADVNLRTGISRLTAKGKRAKGILTPKSADTPKGAVSQ
jgi:lipopolysaccharide export system protein LptA